MEALLQVWGGLFYLLNKIFMWFCERARRRGEEEKERGWRISAWAIYLAGLPPWLILLVGWRNWIVASVEASGAPAMMLGLVIAIHGIDKKTPRWLENLAIVCIPLGFYVSIQDFGGINTLNQWLEIGLVLGFLVGTYMLAKKKTAGYLWYVLMHIACAWLMWIQNSPWLFAQQALSLLFIADAYRIARKP